MATKEEELISAICHNKDISTILAANLDDLFGDWEPVFESLKSYHRKYGSVPDIEILQERFPDLESAPVKADSKYYLDALKNDYMSAKMDRIFTKAGGLLNNRASAEILDKVQKELAKLNKYNNTVRDLNLKDYDDAENFYKKVRERADEMGGSPGIPTGVDSIDASYTTGMAPGHMIVAIGWPGKAKTWFTSLLAVNAHKKGFKPLIFSLEMSPENMRDRIYTIMGAGTFSASGLARGDVDLDTLREWGKNYLEDKQDFEVISPDGMQDVTPNVVQAKIEQYRPDLVIIDYAQLLSDNRKSDAMTPRMMNLSREVKQLAVSNGIPVILITAATAEESSDRNTAPTLDKVAWSKAIEYDADMAFAVQRHDDTGIVEVVGRKNRHGELFSVFLNWDLDSGVLKEEFNLPSVG